MNRKKNYYVKQCELIPRLNSDDLKRNNCIKTGLKYVIIDLDKKCSCKCMYKTNTLRYDSLSENNIDRHRRK
jgi:hypothetical protein